MDARKFLLRSVRAKHGPPKPMMKGQNLWFVWDKERNDAELGAQTPYQKGVERIPTNGLGLPERQRFYPGDCDWQNIQHFRDSIRRKLKLDRFEARLRSLRVVNHDRTDVLELYAPDLSSISAAVEDVVSFTIRNEEECNLEFTIYFDEEEQGEDFDDFEYWGPMSSTQALNLQFHEKDGRRDITLRKCMVKGSKCDAEARCTFCSSAVE